MTIDEAIEKLDRYLKHHNYSLPLPVENAIKLSVEAMRFYRLLKANGAIPLDRFLPGETEEYIPRNIGKLPSDEDYAPRETE